jgi:hypothetical protein
MGGIGRDFIKWVRRRFFVLVEELVRLEWMHTSDKGDEVGFGVLQFVWVEIRGNPKAIYWGFGLRS